jgi:threonine-phosphate decarboxylase
MLARHFRPQRALILGPAFAEYEESLAAASLPAEYAVAKESDGFLMTPETVSEALKLRPDAVFVASPANPTGRLAPDETMELLLSWSEKSGRPLIVDEAFIDFTFGRSLIGRAETHPGLIVLRSLTKIYAVPGLRLAYLAARPELVKTFKSLMEPWPINLMALEAGRHSLRMREWTEGAKEATKALRPMLEEALAPCGRTIPSDANFVLVKCPPEKTGALIHGLFQKGILVRDASNFRGLGPGWLRFAVRPEGEIRSLKEALESIREALGPLEAAGA